MPVLSQIYVYPVKSLQGFAVTQWAVDRNGLLYDRHWMLVDKQGQFLSQRRLPKMALIATQLNNSELRLSAAGHGQMALPLQPEDGELLEAAIWHDRCLVQAVSAEADAWLSDVLECDCRLVLMPDDTVRRVDPQYAQPSDQTAFSDGFPFLLISENSLHSLNQAMSLEMTMTRFRPNLVVAGCAAYAEDTWRAIRINTIRFRLPKPCSRCTVPTIDPISAENGKEPLLTLNQLRRWNNKVYFGQNALHDACGELAVGQPVIIEEIGQAQPPL